MSLPLPREGLWQLVKERGHLVERGLRIVAEGLELGTAQLGVVDGLMRDASGGPVLAFVTDEHDATLVARVVAAHAFWQRNQANISRAMPEADLRRNAPCRLLVLGDGLRRATIEALAGLALDRLEIVEFERFRVGEQERLAVRIERLPAAATVGPLPPAFDSSIGPAAQEVFLAIEAIVQRLDSRARIDGDRFSRRVSIEGRFLCEAWFVDGRVHGALPDSSSRPLPNVDAVRAFGDLVTRHYLGILAVGGAASAPGAAGGAAPEPAPAREGAAREGLESLRVSVSQSRVSREEYSALGEPDVGEEPRPSG